MFSLPQSVRTVKTPVFPNRCRGMMMSRCGRPMRPCSPRRRTAGPFTHGRTWSRSYAARSWPVSSQPGGSE